MVRGVVAAWDAVGPWRRQPRFAVFFVNNICYIPAFRVSWMCVMGTGANSCGDAVYHVCVRRRFETDSTANDIWVQLLGALGIVPGGEMPLVSKDLHKNVTDNVRAGVAEDGYIDLCMYARLAVHALALVLTCFFLVIRALQATRAAWFASHAAQPRRVNCFIPIIDLLVTEGHLKDAFNIVRQVSAPPPPPPPPPATLFHARPSSSFLQLLLLHLPFCASKIPAPPRCHRSFPPAACAPLV